MRNIRNRYSVASSSRIPVRSRNCGMKKKVTAASTTVTTAKPNVTCESGMLQKHIRKAIPIASSIATPKGK